MERLGNIMAELPKGIYRHFKGRLYELLESDAIHTESFEDLVIYKAMYTDSQWGRHRVWARPKEMFLGEVKHKGVGVKRFEYAGRTLEEALKKLDLRLKE